MINWQPGVTLESVENQIVVAAMQFYMGNKAIVARSLGIDPKTLTAKLKKMEAAEAAAVERMKEIEAREREYERRARGLPAVDNTPKSLPEPANEIGEPERVPTPTPQRHPDTLKGRLPTLKMDKDKEKKEDDNTKTA